MRKIVALILLILLLQGCSTYRVIKGSAPYDNGYVVTRDKKMIVEYTLGRDNTVARDTRLANERFRRRRKTVETYYKKMGYLEPRGKEMFWNPPVALFKFFLGIFRLPFVAYADYKFDHDPKYREKILAADAKKDAADDARRKALREELNAYVQRDADLEGQVSLSAPSAEQAHAAAQEAALSAAALPDKKPVEKKSAAAQSEATFAGPVAVVKASPQKGYSPLRVRFNGSKSYNKASRIIAYSWDFGDGDSSSKPNPVNIYYSGSFEPRVFTATLTVTDRNGKTASAQANIEVRNE